jgi:hypothetical protein
MNDTPHGVADASAAVNTPEITVTGADERTDLDRLCRLDAEIGILYTETPEGRNRYPRREWIQEVGWSIQHLAIHICGLRARGALFSGRLDDMAALAGRIQVNGRLSANEVITLCRLFPDRTIITQHSEANQWLEVTGCDNHALLVDQSGGRGISPEKWARPATEKPVGFAGGLGPRNLATELPKIQAVARGEWWVDMEGNLRVDDWFSVELAEEAVSIFANERAAQ